MTDLFLIAGGGTGAKVAEAFVHLCAAGLGPDRAHVLLVDTDAANGNLARTAATARAYSDVRRWGWGVEAEIGGGLFRSGRRVSARLFATELVVHQLTRPVRTVSEGGLEKAVSSDGMHRVLDLLFDEDEQQADCTDGFRARPNLGCLVMAGHLDEHLRDAGGSFVRALKEAAQKSDRVPVAVAASVFGGTGAALLPVVRGALEDALRQDGAPSLDRYEFGAVQLLPHYRPASRIDSVDPDRYLLDTASALQYYGTTMDGGVARSYDAVYLVGSDDPSRNRVRPVLGQKKQANPPYFEELLAALAVRDFGGGGGGDRVRLFVPKEGGADLTWDDLPVDDKNAARAQFGYLLHLGAFLLRRGDRRHQLTMGMAALLDGLDDEHIYAFPWYRTALDGWAAEQSERYRSESGGGRVRVLKDDSAMGSLAIGAALRPATEYFGRALLWADSALSGEGLRLFAWRRDDYAGLYHTMDRLTSGAAEPADSGGGGEGDNALVRALRTALVAMVEQHEKGGSKRGGGLELTDDQGRVAPNVEPRQVQDAAAAAGLGDLTDDYIRTRVEPA